jgi:hypothetical protein
MTPEEKNATIQEFGQFGDGLAHLLSKRDNLWLLAPVDGDSQVSEMATFRTSA